MTNIWPFPDFRESTGVWTNRWEPDCFPIPYGQLISDHFSSPFPLLWRVQRQQTFAEIRIGRTIGGLVTLAEAGWTIHQLKCCIIRMAFHYNLPAGIAAKYEWNHTENLLPLEAEDYTQMILESDVLATSISLAGNLILSLSYPRMPCFHMLPCVALSGFFVVE